MPETFVQTCERHGPDARWYASSRECVDCKKEYARQRYATDPEFRQHSRRYSSEYWAKKRGPRSPTKKDYREAARRRSEQFFVFPCKHHGENAQRYVSTGGCVECQEKQSQEYQQSWRWRLSYLKRRGSRKARTTMAVQLARLDRIQQRIIQKPEPFDARGYEKERRRTDAAYRLLKSTKKRAKDAGINNTLTIAQIRALIPEDGRCPVFKKPFDLSGGAGYKPMGMSVDRFDPSDGYNYWNCYIISRKANTIKSNASADEVLMVASWMHQTGKETLLTGAKEPPPIERVNRVKSH